MVFAGLLSYREERGLDELIARARLSCPSRPFVGSRQHGEVGRDHPTYSVRLENTVGLDEECESLLPLEVLDQM